MQILKKLFVGVVFLSMVGCAATPNMDHSEYTADVLKPDAGKAMVVFMRPSMLGFIISAAVYDDETFIGMVPYQSKLAYMATPGPHRFMVVSEAADFLTADLEAGKTYYALVNPRMGMWRARFSLEAVHRGRVDSAEFQQWLTESKFVKNKPSAEAWATSNHDSVLTKKNEYLGKWLQKPESERPALRKDDGR